MKTKGKHFLIILENSGSYNSHTTEAILEFTKDVKDALEVSITANMERQISLNLNYILPNWYFHILRKLVRSGFVHVVGFYYVVFSFYY